MIKKINLFKKILKEYLAKVPEVREYCDKCLRTERWGGSVSLMIIDAAFTSIGLNYFTAVVPKVMQFKKDFVDKGIVKDLCDLSNFNYEKAMYIWKNRRSWEVIKKISEYFCKLKKEKNLDDKGVFRLWAKNAKAENFKKDPIGKIKGVGIITFQYLRMMGGVDTVMPDKIVKRVLNEIFEKAEMERVEDNFEFINKVHEISKIIGERPIDLCWMTWLIQREGERVRIEKYKEILEYI